MKSSSSVVQTFGDVEIGKMSNRIIGLVDEHSLKGFVSVQLEQGASVSFTSEK